MGDFYQNGIITTLHNLSKRPLAELEHELTLFAKNRPLCLVLPSLYSELEGTALDNIIKHLQKVPYLSEVIIGLDRANEQEYRDALKFFSRLPQNHKVLWNDGPRLQMLHQQLNKKGLSPGQPGKGRNVWFCFGYVLASGRASSVALHDCDILTYDREMLARLIYPVANPNFNYTFCKGYYARVADGRLNGRVSRLLVTPLLRALKKTLGHSSYLEYLDSYRYPLAGEFSLRTDAINDIRIPSDWGLEVGMLFEMKRNFATNRLCQVDIADTYDHKHQVLSAENDKTGLSKMSIDIAKSIFRKLATDGVVFSNETFRSIKATYYRIALDFVETYNNDGIINGLQIDIHKEEQAVETFAENILKAGLHFLENPMETPFIPPWNRVNSALPCLQADFMAAVEEDMREFGAPVTQASATSTQRPTTDERE
jgi:glucosyl-3-phosphoglycerate synthase